MTDSRFAYDEEEQALRSAARKILAASCDTGSLTAMYDNAANPARPWALLRQELGIGGLLIDGAAGSDASDHDAFKFAAVVAEEIGRHVAPVPFLTSSVVASIVATQVGAEELCHDIAAGATVAVVVPWTASHADMLFTCELDGDGSVTGRVAHVAGALEADFLLVPASDEEGQRTLLQVPSEHADVLPISALDMTRPLATVQLNTVTPKVLARGPGVTSALRRALASATIVLGSEQLGIAEVVLERTIEYLKVRRQFGRQIGSFQAIKHRVADMWVDLEGLRAIARHSATDTGAPVEYRASLLASYASEISLAIVEDCLQLQGGVAMTWEHPLHFHLKRAKANQIALGTPGRHRELLGDLINITAPA